MKIGHVISDRTSNGMREKKRAEKKEEEKESFREKDSTFSLNFSTIGPAVSGGAIGRVHHHGKGFA